MARVEASVLDAAGLILPEGALGEALWRVVEPLDHRHLNDLAPFQDRPPTPAVMAEWVGGQLAARLAGVRIRRIEVWTSPTAYAGWEP